MHKVTLVIPTKNRINILCDAVQSACHLDIIQEIIVVDDNSTVPLSEEAFKNIIDFNKITILKNQSIPGAQGSRVTGAQYASTDLLLFLDSDDLLLPDGVLELYNRICDNENLALVYGNILFGQIRSNWIRVKENAYLSVLRNLSLCPFSGLMVRKSLIPWNELDLALPAWQDDDFCLTVARKGDINFVDTCVAINHHSDDSISRSKGRQLIGLYMLIEKWKDEILDKYGIFRLFLWRIRGLGLMAQVIGSDFSLQVSADRKKYLLKRLASLLFNAIGHGIKILVKPFFDRVYT